MTDRELLELAAKAAGYRVHGWINDRLYVVDPNRADQNFDPFVWSPLTDDGDALRLAVKLGFAVSVCTGYTAILDGQTRVNHDGDPYAATRRAIVRAAASIGEQLCRT